MNRSFIIIASLVMSVCLAQGGLQISPAASGDIGVATGTSLSLSSGTVTTTTTNGGINLTGNGTGHLLWDATKLDIDSTGYAQFNNTIQIANGHFRMTNTASGLVWFISSAYDLGILHATPSVASFSSDQSDTAGATWRSKPRSPSQIVANTDNYNPGGTSFYQRWSTDASRNVTGLTFTSAQVDGQTHVIVNVGSFDIVLKHLTTSTSANQFQNSTGADITMTPGTEVNCWYDGTTAKWRVTKRGF